MPSSLVSSMGTPSTYFNFITLLRAIAAIVITNSHYTGIYPTDMIANGGLLGDVIFFSVSGFCLANPRLPFKSWYPKRLLRIYVVVWIITLIYVLCGVYEIHSSLDVIKSFIHPTKYHFVASITLLYIPLFFVAKNIELCTKNYTKVALLLFLAQLAVYYIFYDRTYYHIDTVREPMIEFLFFQSMLLGLHFRWRCNNWNKQSQKKCLWTGIVGIIILFGTLGMYFASKLLFVKNTEFAEYQIVNQIILYACLFILFRFFMLRELVIKKYEGKIIWKVISFLSDHTLEIYCVQSVIIVFFRDMRLPFPVNWLCITIGILLSAALLRWMSQKIIKGIRI